MIEIQNVVIDTSLIVNNKLVLPVPINDLYVSRKGNYVRVSKTQDTQSPSAKYNVKESYLYDVTYNYDVVMIPFTDASDVHSITTNDGLIMLINTAEGTYKIYDVFGESAEEFTFDTELSENKTIYKSTTSYSPFDEKIFILFKNGKKTYHELMVFRLDDRTHFIGYHDIDKMSLDLYDKNFNKIEGGEIQAEDLNFYSISGKELQLYASEIIMPNKPYYRIHLYSDAAKDPTIKINGEIVSGQYLQKVGNLILIKNKVVDGNYIKLTIDVKDKLYVGVI